MSNAELVRAPQQERSRDTLRRMFDAAERLMAERSFEKITVQQIVKEAGTTIGAFYTRFKDKDALLESMHAEHIAENVALYEQTMSDLPGLAAHDRLELLVEMIGSAFRSRPALMRSGTLVFWNNPSGSKFGATLTKTHKDFSYQIRRLRGELQKIAEDLDHPSPSGAANFALKIMLASSRQHFLFTDDRTILKISHRVFLRELTDMVFQYLSHGGHGK